MASSCTSSRPSSPSSPRTIAAYPLWVRNLYGETSWSRDRKVLFRQFASHARLGGIDGPVDLNLFAGSKTQFAELVARATVTP